MLTGFRYAGFIKPILLPFILFVYIVWWGVIAFANFPDSSLTIASNLGFYRSFDKIFYQRWGFFAPPPTEDERLYYVFTNIKDKSKSVSFEIFENILKEKNRAYLFNDDLTNLDYILHNSISPIEDMLRDGYEIYKYKNNCLHGKDSCTYKAFMSETRSTFNKTPFVKTLLRHAGIIKERHGLNDDYKLQIIVSLLDLPRYAERFMNKERLEQPYFKSDYYNYTTQKWEKFTE